MNQCASLRLNAGQRLHPPRTFQLVLTCSHPGGQPTRRPLSHRTFQTCCSTCRCFSPCTQPPPARRATCLPSPSWWRRSALPLSSLAPGPLGEASEPRARATLRDAELSTVVSWEPLPGSLGSWSCSFPPELGVGRPSLILNNQADDNVDSPLAFLIAESGPSPSF